MWEPGLIAQQVLESPYPMDPADAAYALAIEHAEDLVHALRGGAEIDDLLAIVDRIRRLVESTR